MHGTNELKLNRLQEILANQRDVLSMAMQGHSLSELFEKLLTSFDKLSGAEIRASSIHIVDNLKLKNQASPALSQFVRDQIHEIPVDAVTAPMGTSVHHGETVLVKDVDSESRFSSLLGSIAKDQIRSVRSIPMFAKDGLILGTFSVYGEAVDDLSQDDEELIELVVSTASVLIERHLGTQDRVWYEAEIERARQQMSEVFSQAPVALCVTEGPEHIFSFVNTVFFESYTNHTKDIFGRAVREVFPKSVDEGFTEILDRVYRTGEPHIGTEYPTEIYLSNGGTKKGYINFIYQPKRDMNGDVDGIICVFTDVTEQVESRKLLEKAKLEVENERENFQNLFGQTPEMVCILKGPEHRFEFVNDAHIKILGKDATGQTVREAQPESVEVHSILDKVYETGVTAELREIAVTVGDRLRHFNLTYAARMDTDGVIDGVMILGTEITDQVDIRKEIEDSRKWLEHILNRLPIALFLMDPKTSRVIFANEAAEKLMGFSPTGTLPQSASRIYKIDVFDKYGDLLEAEDRPSARALRGEAMKNEEFYLQGPGGRYHIAAYSETIGDLYQHGSTTLMLFQDISPIKAAQAAAEAANMAKSSFLANMSHEIRTPLGAIMGFLDLMKSPNASREDINSYVQVIDRNSDQLLRLIDDILDLSKVEAGKMFFENLEFSLRDQLSDFSKMMKFKAQEKGIIYNLKLTSDVPERVIGDPLRIRQILTNVVGNAIKFTERGSVSLDVSYNGDELRFVVTDTGRGISIEQSQKLFRPFAQADSSTTRAYGGTGLGLVLTRRIANAMGGDFILQRSELGQGSVFFASVRIGVPSDCEMMKRGELYSTAAVRANAPQEQVLSGMSILVVEDAIDNQALLNILLGKLGARISIASDGKEGAAMAANDEFDVILMDVQMPVMDGHEATRYLRSKQYAKPIIALTAHAMKEERERCEASGFTDFLTKPIQQSSLVQMLERFRQ